MRQTDIKWEDLTQLSFERERMGDAKERAGQGGAEDLFIIPEEMDLLHLEVVQELIREISDDELEEVGAAIIATVNGVSGMTLPLNCVRIVSVAIQLEDGDTIWHRAREVSVALWHQAKSIPAADFLRYVLKEGKVYFNGSSIDIQFIVEPSLAICKFDSAVLPAGKVEERLDRVHQLILAIDRIPDQA